MSSVISCVDYAISGRNKLGKDPNGTGLGHRGNYEIDEKKSSGIFFSQLEMFIYSFKSAVFADQNLLTPSQSPDLMNADPSNHSSGSLLAVA